MSNARFGLRVRNGLVRSITEGNTAVNILLNLYPGASAAYSLRLLRSNYLGNAIRVRRSSDNTEQSIGFVNDVLDTASLSSFVGANNGFITTWFDQSGNGVNLTQPTLSLQPQIVSSGSIITVNGLPALRWTNGQNQLLTNNLFSLPQSSTIFSLSKLSSASGINASTIYDSFNNVQTILYHTGNSEVPNNNLIIANGVSLNLGISTTTYNLITAFNSGGSSFVRINGALTSSGNSGTNGFSGLTIGNIRANLAPGYDFSGEIGEIIFYSGSQNNNGIENNIRTYYGI